MDDDQQFCLRWNNHQSTLVAVFDTLLENEKLVDCTLAAEGKFLNAHKVVLSACSPYFESLLSRHYDKHPILILKDVKFQELKAMMDYMYRGEVNISQDQLGALLKAAESLQIKGLSDNKKDDQPTKRPAPAPAPPKSPQPQTQLPKVQGLTIEQRSRDDREGSMSPGPRKKKRMRRKSEEMDNHHDASNSSDAHSLPPQNIPSATTQLPSNIKLNSDVPETIETKQEILTRHKEEIGSQQTQVPMIKEKLETHTELMLEPKSEYVEEMNEDSIEDLTLDDDDLSNMDQMDDGAGPSHGGEGSSQGFGHWQMGNQSQDEVFLAAQEAVGAHRDSQGRRRGEREYTRKPEKVDPNYDYERRPLPSYYTSQPREVQHLDERRYLNNQNKQALARSLQQYDARNISQKQFQERPQLGTSEPVARHKRLEPKRAEYYKTQSTIANESRAPAETHFVDKRRAEADFPPSTKSSRPVFQKPLEPNKTLVKVKGPQELDAKQDIRYQKSVRNPQEFVKTSVHGSGLLTDSLSCIFTRRTQKINQHKIPQKRVFFEAVDESKPNENQSTDDQKQRCNVSVDRECPEPPVISQATPNISNEDWFTTKQRILSSVNREPSRAVYEPQPPVESKCPEPPQISLDPHGFDIEPPAHLQQNVSPYVPTPTNSLERDEYNKYKSKQLRNESALILAQKKYKQGFEAPPARSDEDDGTERHYRSADYEVEREAQERGVSYESNANLQQRDSTIYSEPDRRSSYDHPSHNDPPDHHYQDEESSYADKAADYKNASSGNYYQDNAAYEDRRQDQNERFDMYDDITAQNENDAESDPRNRCPEPPHISEDSRVHEREKYGNAPPDAPMISRHEVERDEYYQDDDNFGSSRRFAESDEFNVDSAQAMPDNQNMCHKCSFQTTNSKKLKDHLKFVHGEVVSESFSSNTEKTNELFSRREPKINEQNVLFSRRVATGTAVDRFRRRNTSNVVTVISTDVVVPPNTNYGDKDNRQSGDKEIKSQDSGVQAAMEYFETTKDQPKKARPYKRNQDEMLKNDWIQA